MTAKVAEGTRVGDGVITLAASGGSGLTGSATVTYTADDIDALNVIDCVNSNSVATSRGFLKVFYDVKTLAY
jgi:hypothetical protein